MPFFYESEKREFVRVGVAVPVAGQEVDIYEINLKNVSIKGVWVSDTSHFVKAVRLVEEGLYPFGEMISHRLPLESAQEALNMGKETGVMKVVLVP